MNRKIVIFVLAVLVFFTATMLKNAGNEPSTDAAVQDQSSTTETPLPRLVDLGSDKCIPCKKMAPILEELSVQYANSFVVEVIDIKKNPTAGEPYEIRVIPTQIFFDASGQERFRHEGFMAQDAILAKWVELGVALKPISSPEDS